MLHQLTGTAPFEPQWTIVRWAYDRGPPGERLAGLRRALNRAREVSGPRRVLLALLEQDAPWWRPLVEWLPRENIIVQPFERGSGTAVLIAALVLRRRDAEARVVLMDPARPGASLRLGVGPLLERFRSQAPETATACESAERDLGPLEQGSALDVVFPRLSCTELNEVWPASSEALPS